MAILVTGAAGYVGSHIALELLDRGRDVVVVDNLSTGVRELVPGGARFINADVSDFARMTDVLKEHDITAVIHCAGSTVVPESVSDPEKYYRNNTLGTLSLLRAMVCAGVGRFIFSSTAAVYGPPESGELVDEAAELSPVTPYGRSKWMAETIARDIATASGISCCILRYFNVAGADPVGRSGQATPDATHLIKVTVEAALGLRPHLEVFGVDWPTRDGTGVRDYIHVSDLAHVHEQALCYLENGGKSIVLNCGYGRGYSVREVIDAVQRVANSKLKIVERPRRPGDLAEVVADPTRLVKLFDWKPQFGELESIVQHAVDWERRRRQLQSVHNTYASQ